MGVGEGGGAFCTHTFPSINPLCSPTHPTQICLCPPTAPLHRPALALTSASASFLPPEAYCLPCAPTHPALPFIPIQVLGLCNIWFVLSNPQMFPDMLLCTSPISFCLETEFIPTLGLWGVESQEVCGPVGFLQGEG